MDPSFRSQSDPQRVSGAEDEVGDKGDTGGPASSVMGGSGSAPTAAAPCELRYSPTRLTCGA
eukprot:169023-Rhodomonas_salina.1